MQYFVYNFKGKIHFLHLQQIILILQNILVYYRSEQTNTGDIETETTGLSAKVLHL